MASDLCLKILFRLVLPLILLGACIFRYNALSAIYLIFLLVIPLLPSPSRRGSRAPIYLQSFILSSSIVFVLSQIIFQVVLLSYKPYGHFFKECSEASDISAEIGFHRFDICAVKDIIRLLAPDIIVFACSIIAVLSCRHLSATSTQHDTVHSSQVTSSGFTHFEEILPLFGVLLLLLAGISQPNVLSAVYFLAFLLFGICWAFHFSDHVRKSSAIFIIKVILTVYAGLHVFVLYLYQLPFFQTTLHPTDFVPRLLGLTAIINSTDCTKQEELILNRSLPWPSYVYPLMVFLLYWILAVDNRIKYRKHFASQKMHLKSKTIKDSSPLLDGGDDRQYGSIQPEQPAIRVDELQENVLVQGTFSSIMMFLMRQSYIAALIIMMAWSITYHSWLSFVLLLWACLTWITPFARWFCMASSPYLVIYADLLLIVQYIYGMNLRDDELPIKEGNFDFAELGLVRSNYPGLHLGAQTIFTWVFLVTLRQHYREKRIQQKKGNSSEMVLTNIARPIMQAFKRKVNSIEEVDHAGTPSDDAKELMVLIKSTLAKYWILVCCAAFLIVALQNHVSLYQILYMVIFLMGFVVYQFSLRTWKTILRPLWWFMVVYSIIILLLIYTYQFDNMHQIWSNGTHLNDEWLDDIGLRQQSKARLLLELLIPTIFSIIIVIQLHFFHKPLVMKINRLLKFRRQKKKADKDSPASKTNTSFTNDASSTQASMASSSTACVTTLTQVDAGISNVEEIDTKEGLTVLSGLKKKYSQTTVFLWRFGEIHAPKFVTLIAMLVVVQQVSAVNAVLIILLAIAMLSDNLQRFINYIMVVWSSIIVLVYMFYQLQFVKESMLNTNCSANGNMTYPIPRNGSHFSSNSWWLGFHKSDNVSRDVRGYLFIVLAIVFQKVIKHHQELYRYRNNLAKPCNGILFDNITRPMADENVVTCIKYLCNHIFDLFGIEINLMVMVICMSVRGDAVSVIHSLWVLTFLLVSHGTAVKLWSIYVSYLSVMLPLQYILILGWPPGLCKGYPWDMIEPEGLVQWLALTDVENPQNQYLLLADFFQLLVACCQATVVSEESNEKKPSPNLYNNIFNHTVSQYSPPDFICNKTWLDFFKILILDQFLWLSLTVVYITAQQTTSLFNSGFMVGCFFFLWHGQGLYLRKRQTMRRWWKTFIMYNFFVIVAKCWLQLVSCVFISSIYDQTDCYLIQLLNLYCLRSDVYNIPPATDEDCIAQYDTGLMMDTLCFCIALVQYRIFNSVYFKYVIREHRKQSEIAYRGAQLVEERLQIRLSESIQRDQKTMQLIRNKVFKLKKRLAQLNPKAQEPLSHYEAIYAGDYYLFEDSETDSDSDVKDDDADDFSLSTTVPKETSEQNQRDSTTSTTHEDDPVQSEEDMSNVLAGDDVNVIQTEGIRRRHGGRHDESAKIIEDVQSENTKELAEGADEDLQFQKTWKEKYQVWWNSIKLFFIDVSTSATNFLNETSNDYCYITTQLAQERKERAKSLSHSDNVDQPEIIITSPTKEDESDTWSIVPSEDEKDSWKKTDSCSVRLFVALYYALLANTDLVCYSLMIINHMYYACVLSIPLPFFVFLWGMLSIPRPTKRFWITVITYVELVIVVKYIFQFQFPEDQHLNFNECSYYEVKEAKSPLCPPRIIGIERNQYSSVCDLLLLLGLFFHRFALKAHGLWKDKAFNDEEDTTPRKKPVAELAGDNINPTNVTTTNVVELPALIENQRNPESNTANDTISSVHPNRKASIFHNVKRFIQRMLDPQVGTGAVDVYAWMFAAQFTVFVIILSSWSAFSSSREAMSNFAKIIEDNNVPKTFLYMLLTQFLLIVLDRYLYMRKQVFAKLIYLAVLIVLFHVFLFIIVPDITQRSFTKNIPSIFMYLFQCIYFGLSAYQVRCGYPTCILGNFLTKNYTVTSGILFQAIQAIPFLLELRSVLDWVCTKTTLTLNHWLKMEDIYANIFVMKCWRDSEKTWPHPRGQSYWQSSKWLVGGILLTLLIAVIWFPLLLMSFINSAYISNRPVEVTFTLTVGGYQPLFKVSTQQQFLKELSSHEINTLIGRIKDWSPGSKGPNWDFSKIEQELQDYKKTGTIVRVKVLSNSSAIWTISPPSRDFLINDLESNSSISLRFTYVFSREPNTSQTTIVQETVSGVTVRPLLPGDAIRRDLAKALKSPSGDGEIEIPNLFPTFMQVPASGPVKPVSWIGDGSYVKCKLILRRGSAPHLNTTQVEWWDIVQEDPKPIFSKKPGYLEMIALNDLVPPLHLSFFANKGIIGLYVGFVWLVGKFVRLFFTSISYRIMYDELPNVNRILKLCLEIYMVRESKELKLEEDLFSKLLFLYRSPETLIKWTKYKRLKTN